MKHRVTNVVWPVEEYFWDACLWDTSHETLYSDRRSTLGADSDPEVLDALLEFGPELTVEDTVQNMAACTGE